MKQIKYGQPRRFNTITLSLLVTFLIVGYLAWRFFPAYFQAWNVDHVLSESASAVYKVNRSRDELRVKGFKELVDKARSQIQNPNLAGVDDPDLDVSLDLDEDSQKATMSATYTVVVTHPFFKKTTTLHFHREESASIKAVSWE